MDTKSKASKNRAKLGQKKGVRAHTHTHTIYICIYWAQRAHPEACHLASARWFSLYLSHLLQVSYHSQVTKLEPTTLKTAQSNQTLPGNPTGLPAWFPAQSLGVHIRPLCLPAAVTTLNTHGTASPPFTASARAAPVSGAAIGPASTQNEWASKGVGSWWETQEEGSSGVTHWGGAKKRSNRTREVTQSVTWLPWKPQAVGSIPQTLAKWWRRADSAVWNLYFSSRMPGVVTESWLSCYEPVLVQQQ